MKNQSKKYSEGHSLKYAICTTLYLLHENIAKIGFIHRIKRVAGREMMRMNISKSFNA